MLVNARLRKSLEKFSFNEGNRTMTLARMFCAAAVAVTVIGCQGDPRHTEVSDVVVAGLLESHIGGDHGQAVPTAGGTLLGPYSGSAVGRSLDRADRRHAEEAALSSLEGASDGQTSRWSNPTTGNAGSFTPVNVYRSADNLRCRDYQQTVTAGAQTQSTTGTACQVASGAWRVVVTPARRSTGRERSTR
jgi:surface antigen